MFYNYADGVWLTYGNSLVYNVNREWYFQRVSKFNEYKKTLFDFKN